MTIVQAPFTPDQVEGLRNWQSSDMRHPFTCGVCRDADTNWPMKDQHALVPTEAGWICPTCDYTQDWAHDFMTTAKPSSLHDFLDGLRPTVTVPVSSPEEALEVYRRRQAELRAKNQGDTP